MTPPQWKPVTSGPWKHIAIAAVCILVVVIIIGSLLPDDPEITDTVPQGLSAAELATMGATQYEAWLRAHDLSEDVIQQRLDEFPTRRANAGKSIRYTDIVHRIDRSVRDASTGTELWHVCENAALWLAALEEAHTVGE